MLGIVRNENHTYSTTLNDLSPYNSNYFVSVFQANKLQSSEQTAIQRIPSKCEYTCSYPSRPHL